MKKLFFMAVAAIAALSSCTSDNELELNQNTGKEALTFTATMEDSEATRATYDNTNQYALWEAGDQISINGVSYSAQAAGTTTTFKATTEGEEAEGPTYKAYFPADLFDGTTATLPAIQTYEEGKFNMPMYATSTSTELAFKNLCAVLAIKVTSADITKLKSIKVASDQKMNGKFTVTDNAAVINDDKGTNAVVLESSEALTLDETGTTFYIAIPAQTYQYLNIFLSADGETYTQAMATKKKDGLGTIARSKIFNIDYAKNATKLWEGNLLIADCNVGATAENIYGGLYTWGGTQNAMVSYTDDHNTGTDDLSGSSDTATKLWGSNWRMPTSIELTKLNGLGSWDNTNKGLLCTGKDAYSSNTVFLPAAGYYEEEDGFYGKDKRGIFWTSTPPDVVGEKSPQCLFFSSSNHTMGSEPREFALSVRAVLEEAAIPAPAAEHPEGSRGKATATIGGGNVEVNWVQLWENGPKFAEYNVGADNNKAEDYGGYYAWGGSTNKGTDYNTGTSSLSGETDTATKLWGSKWRMPTKEEFDNLLAKCTVEWIDGSNKKYNNTTATGLLCTGMGAYSSNSIFLPAASYFLNGSVVDPGKYVRYWSSTPFINNNNDAAYLLCCASNEQVVDDLFRARGYSVRAVLNTAE